MKKSLSDISILVILNMLGVMLIWRQEAVSSAIIESTKNCVYRIIPSLFAMTVISTAISNSGLVGMALQRSKIDANIFTAFLFGNIGGYPIGAKLLSEMVRDGRMNKSQAEKAIVFCFGSGPAFAAGVAGTAIFGDVRYGLAALSAGILANLTLYFLYAVISRESPKHTINDSNGFTTSLMIESVSSSTNSMISICSMIVFFAALRAVIESVYPKLRDMKYLAGVLEISNIASLSGLKGISLVAVALLLSFGGLCVHMQLFAIIDGQFSLRTFYLSRIIALPLAGAYAFLLEILLHRLPIFSAVTTKIRLSQSPSLIPIICVIAMVFITILEKGKRTN